ncbi:MAG: adenylyl-sulfate kinase [Kangiellaceae bacterium]|jgi:adenylyl-sulfate kinase|nr:adenylyl-sulfate kinase [Kangiellaceae bacterium]|tara:strand:- start:9946 stop:10545 length:600 start_codon:yes stop_codon:yes gene_type:complete
MSNIVWHDHNVTAEERAKQKNQKPCVLWFTGLSGSGKSTIANAVDGMLYEMGYHTFLLDGDNVRHGLCGDLGFSDEDRNENIRRIGEVAKLFSDAGLITSTAFISPFIADREVARKIQPEGTFIEVFVDTPLDVCESRDPKGLYKKARAGEIKFFTGIDSPYEAPEAPELTIKTAEFSIQECAEQVINYLKQSGFLLGA